MATDVSSGGQSSNGLSGDTLIKSGVGRLVRVSVTTAGAAGAVHDAGAVAGAGAGNLIAVVPAAVGVYYLDWPVLNGIVYKPGAAQVASFTYT